MKPIKSISSLIMFLLFTLIAVSTLANKTTVKITAVKSATKGTEVTVTLSVSHNANTPYHFTDWVYLKIILKVLSPSL